MAAGFHRRYRELIRLINDCAIDYLFITGLQKSGTSWLQMLINAHPEVGIHTPGEGWLIDTFMSCIDHIRSQFKRGVSYYDMSEEDASVLTRFFTELVLLENYKVPGIRIVGEKSPNYRDVLPMVLKLFPNCKIIHVVRDGRDVVISRIFHEFRFHKDRIFQKYGLKYETFDGEIPDELIIDYLSDWKNGIKKIRAQYIEKPNQFCEVKYEGLINEAHDALKNTFLFLNVKISDEIISNCLTKGDFSQFSNGRKRGEEDNKSFFRKGIVGDHKNYFKASQIEMVNARYGDFFSALGY